MSGESEERKRQSPSAGSLSKINPHQSTQFSMPLRQPQNNLAFVGTIDPQYQSTPMKNTFIAIGVMLVALALLFALVGVASSNKEIRLRNAITAKQRDNQSELDNVQKKIKQSVQVTDIQVVALKEIIIGNAQARKGGSGSLATMVQEAVPNVDTRTFENLQNIIAGSRDAFTTRQKELLDLKREHDNCIDVWPSSMFCGSRGKIEVTIVTSSRVKENFSTGEDNDTNLR